HMLQFILDHNRTHADVCCTILDTWRYFFFCKSLKSVQYRPWLYELARFGFFEACLQICADQLDVDDETDRLSLRKSDDGDSACFHHSVRDFSDDAPFPYYYNDTDNCRYYDSRNNGTGIGLVTAVFSLLRTMIGATLPYSRSVPVRIRNAQLVRFVHSQLLPAMLSGM
ncbi:MAG: hypothetical protein GY826_26865, partial [Fuerstiella sp.]|nr:hypothetical protein [Fuerstiella sp.]